MIDYRSGHCGAAVVGTSLQLVLGPNPDRIAILWATSPVTRYCVGVDPSMVLDRTLTLHGNLNATIIRRKDYGDMVGQTWYAICAQAGVPFGYMTSYVRDDPKKVDIMAQVRGKILTGETFTAPVTTTPALVLPGDPWRQSICFSAVVGGAYSVSTDPNMVYNQGVTLINSREPAWLRREDWGDMIGMPWYGIAGSSGFNIAGMFGTLRDPAVGR